MSVKSRFGLFIAFAGALFATSASADPINLNQWYTVGFFSEGGALTGNCGCTNGTDPVSILAPVGPWTFTTATPVTLTIVDTQSSGDQFDLSDFATDLGPTSTPAGDDTSCAYDISCALADSNYSRGVYTLSAGSHSISGVTTAFLGPGVAFFEVTDAVPEPATLAVLAAGLAGFGAMRRKKKSA